jgi:hypothetical protein
MIFSKFFKTVSGIINKISTVRKRQLIKSIEALPERELDVLKSITNNIAQQNK